MAIALSRWLLEDPSFAGVGRNEHKGATRRHDPPAQRHVRAADGRHILDAHVVIHPVDLDDRDPPGDVRPGLVARERRCRRSPSCAPGRRRLGATRERFRGREHRRRPASAAVSVLPTASPDAVVVAGLRLLFGGAFTRAGATGPRASARTPPMNVETTRRAFDEKFRVRDPRADSPWHLALS